MVSMSEEVGPLTAASLAAAPPGMQKVMLGQRLYRMLVTSRPVLAGQMAGLLLERDNSELLLLLDCPDRLRVAAAQNARARACFISCACGERSARMLWE